MEFVFTLVLFGFCMAIMAIGLLFRRPPLTKDCGLDPITGERIGDCACSAQGKPQCLKRRVTSLFTSPDECISKTRPPETDIEKVIPLPPRDS